MWADGSVHPSAAERKAQMEMEVQPCRFGLCDGSGYVMAPDGDGVNYHEEECGCVPSEQLKQVATAEWIDEATQPHPDA